MERQGDESAGLAAGKAMTRPLEPDATDDAWARQAGPSLTESDAARLLGQSADATRHDIRLLRLRLRSGRTAYPVVQFDRGAPLPGLGEVLRMLAPAADALTMLAWLTGVNAALDGLRPVDALRAGDTSAVVALAARFARSA